MKWRLFLIILIISLQGVLAISSDIRDSYERKETIIGELSGPVLSNIPKSNVELLKDGHIQVAFEYDVKKIGDKYYVWLISPQNPGNYTLLIKNIMTLVEGKQQNLNYEKNFAVTENVTDYSIKPGFIISKEDFFINVILNEDDEKEINVDFPSSKNFILSPGINRIDFSVESVEGIVNTKINLGKYKIPVYVVGKSANGTDYNWTISNYTLNESENSNNSNFNGSLEGAEFKVEPRAIKATALISDKNLNYEFEIINLGEKDILDIEISYDAARFKIEPETIRLIEKNSSLKLNISLINHSGERIRDAVYFTRGNFSDYFIFDIDFTENEDEVSTSYDNSNSLYFCETEIANSELCQSNEICEGRSVQSKDENGVCCNGTCKTLEKKSKAWIGYLVIAVAILILLLIYLKYKKTKPAPNPLDVIKKMGPLPGK